MSRKCTIANKKPMSGNNVSHANNKTKRVYRPNMQSASFHSDILGKRIRFTMSASAIKTISFHGGLDTWIMQAKDKCLDRGLKKLRGLISSKLAS